MTMNVSWPREITIPIHTSLFIPKRSVSSRPHRTRFRTVGNSIYLVRAQCRRTIYIYTYALFFLPSSYINILLCIYIHKRSIEYVRGGDVYRATSRVISYTSVIIIIIYIQQPHSVQRRPGPKCHVATSPSPLDRPVLIRARRAAT